LCALVLFHSCTGLFSFPGGAATPLQIAVQLLTALGCGIELLLIWHYWKGADWGRIFVLVWSFVVAAREVSALIDHDDNLTSLLIHPPRFMQFLLAVFLLYWLNTAPVRAWFKKMSSTAADLMHERLAGRLCTTITKQDGFASAAWTLGFEHDAELILTCPWRIVLDDNLAFASNASSSLAPEPSADDEQPSRLLQNLRVKAVRVTPRTSDLYLTFEMGIELQTWSTSPQTQQWKYSDPSLAVIADSVGLNSQSVTVSAAHEDRAAND
jgi:hypothetical protein